MNSKTVFLSLIIFVFALFVIGGASAIDNDTVIIDNSSQEGDVSSDLEFEQSYDHNIVKKNEIFEVYLTVKNNGLNTYHNLSILYPLPEGLNLLIYPMEYDNQTWFIDTLYPNEASTLTLVCQPLIANTTYDFVVSYGGKTISEIDVYCEPSDGSDIIPDDGMVNVLKSASSGDLKNTANPIFLLLFALIFIPYIRIKY